MSTTDPLLQPWNLTHLTLRNRLMTTAHEPSYSEDGMPKARYRAYHAERAKGGIALTMTAGSALVSRDSPAAFNLHAYDDRIVPWLAELTDECHGHGAAVMIQLTHLGRRTRWNTDDWLPVLAPSRVREPAHRSFPKAAEAWDLERVVADYASAAGRMQAAGLDGIELEAYGHLLDSFWSPATNRHDDEHGGSLDNRLRFTERVLAASHAAHSVSRAAATPHPRAATSPSANLADASPEVRRSATDLHHLNIGPGDALAAEWREAGLELPDLAAMRRYRLERVRAQMGAMGYAGALLMDPMNIRYATDSTNTQVWVMHNAARYCWVGMDDSCIVWEFNECEFLDAHNPAVTEIRPAKGSTYFLAGPAGPNRRTASPTSSSTSSPSTPGGARIAIDQCYPIGYRRFPEAGIEVGNGVELMELARVIKGPDEIRAMRCAVHACQVSMAEMRDALAPGMTEREVWSILHAGNLRRAGEWIETQILASGPRINPWMQEAISSAPTA